MADDNFSDDYETRFPRSQPGVPITIDQMYNLFVNGVVGTKEFRNWLAKIDPNFADVRDSDVDNEIDRLARERSAARNYPPEGEPPPSPLE